MFLTIIGYPIVAISTRFHNRRSEARSIGGVYVCQPTKAIAIETLSTQAKPHRAKHAVHFIVIGCSSGRSRLLSLSGFLSFGPQIVIPGRAFLYRISVPYTEELLMLLLPTILKPTSPDGTSPCLAGVRYCCCTFRRMDTGMTAIYLALRHWH